MIPSGNHVNPHGQQFSGQPRRDSESGGGVLPVGDDEIEVVAIHEVAQVVGHQGAARPAENIANK